MHMARYGRQAPDRSGAGHGHGLWIRHLGRVCVKSVPCYANLLMTTVAARAATTAVVMFGSIMHRCSKDPLGRR